jgi:hypothetical protein
VIGTGLVLATLGGYGSGGSDPSTQESTAASKPGFGVLPTRKCKTQVGYSTNPTPLIATTHAVLPRSVAEGLVAYRDSAGTTLSRPKDGTAKRSSASMAASASAPTRRATTTRPNTRLTRAKWSRCN